MLENLIITLMIAAFSFLALGFITRKWPFPAVALILFVSVGYLGFNIQNNYCEYVSGAFECVTQSTINYELPILMAPLFIMSVVTLFMRVLYKDDDEGVAFTQMKKL